jgi:arylsulfatase
VAPTVLEAAKIPQPKEVAGVKQRPMDGVSMLYSVDAPEAPERHKTQYFEMFGTRGIYHEGWVACTRHSIPWLLVQNPPLKGDVWELYHVDEDFSEARNLAAEKPEKLKELQAVLLYHVCPGRLGLQDYLDGTAATLDAGKNVTIDVGPGFPFTPGAS